MELLILATLILINGFFSMSEMAIATSRRARLQQRLETGHGGAALVLRLTDNPAGFLATVQVGITTIGILSGAFGEDAFVGGLREWIAGFAPLERYAEGLATAAMVIGITYFSVVFGEIVPKRLALQNPEQIAGAVAAPMLLLSRLGHPVVALLSFSSNAVLRLAGVRGNAGEPPVTEEEIRMMLQQGAAAGVFRDAEQEMVDNVFRLDDLRVRAIMTPRLDITFLDLDDPEHARTVLLAGGFETLPVCRGSLDEVLGLVETKALLRQVLEGGELDLGAACVPAVFVPETVTAIKLLETLRQRQCHAALVIDEYGSVEGLVTLTDVLRSIVGDLPGTRPQSQDEIVQRADGSWLLDGMLPTERVLELLGLAADAADDHDYHTLGGFVMDRVGRVPAVGDVFEWQGVRFEVVDMDANRVDRVLASPPPPRPPD